MRPAIKPIDHSSLPPEQYSEAYPSSKGTSKTTPVGSKDCCENQQLPPKPKALALVASRIR